MKQVANSTLLTLLLLVPASVSAQSDVGVYVTGPDLQTKELEFKVVEGQKVKSGFQVKPESVVQVPQGGNLLVVTEPRNNVDNVKVTDGAGKITELVNTNGDTFSLSGINPGVYTLDVIANMPSSGDRAAYETILVILSPGQPPQDPTQIIQKVKIVTDVRVTFEEDDDDDQCSDEEGSAGLQFPYDKKSECQLEEWNDCKNDALRGIKWDDRCKDINHGFTDDCEGFANGKECDEYWKDSDAFCLKNPYHTKCGGPMPDKGPVQPELPICGTPEAAGAELCRDVIDDCTDESGCILPDEEEPVVCQQYVGNECITGPVEGEPTDNEDILSNDVEPTIEDNGDNQREPIEEETEEVEDVEEESTEGTDSGVN
jgi:hypothetical protein